MIYGFGCEHPIGVICRFPCKHCGDDPKRPGESYMTGHTEDLMAPVPMLILAKATRKEYIDFVIAETGHPPKPQMGPYFYRVSMD